MWDFSEAEAQDIVLVDNHMLDVYGDVNTNAWYSFTKGNLELPRGISGFRHVYGYFDVAACGLTSLRGCPEYVSGYFSCHANKLKNLKHGPKYVGGDYHCHSIPSLSTIGRPLEVGGIILIADGVDLLPIREHQGVKRIQYIGY